jgi:hypothetical protein
VHDSPKQWKTWLPLPEFWYNTNYHTTLKSSPFKALYGNYLEMGVMLPKIETTSSPAQQMLKDMDDQLVDFKEHLSTAINRMKLLANKK